MIIRQDIEDIIADIIINQGYDISEIVLSVKDNEIKAEGRKKEN